MGDLWGNWVRSEWIEYVLNHIRRFENTYFLFMTKNPARYHDFINKISKNAILGATIETNRDDLYLNEAISDAPLPSLRYEAMKKLDWDKKFIAINRYHIEELCEQFPLSTLFCLILGTKVNIGYEKCL